MATKGGAGQKGSGSDNSGSKAEGGGLGGSKGGGGGKASGGMGSFGGDRYGSYGGLGYTGPGAGLGFNSGGGTQPVQGSTRLQRNVPTRPGSWSNIRNALGLGIGFGPSTAIGLIGGALTHNDPYSGPTGTGTATEHDQGGNMQGQSAGLHGFMGRPGPFRPASPSTGVGLAATTPPSTPMALPSYILQGLMSQNGGVSPFGNRFGTPNPQSQYLIGNVPQSSLPSSPVDPLAALKQRFGNPVMA